MQIPDLSSVLSEERCDECGVILISNDDLRVRLGAMNPSFLKVKKLTKDLQGLGVKEIDVTTISTEEWEKWQDNNLQPHQEKYQRLQPNPNHEDAPSMDNFAATTDKEYELHQNEETGQRAKDSGLENRLSSSLSIESLDTFFDDLEEDELDTIETITPDKDVDGFHPMNVGNLSSGYDSSVPCTPLGCYLLIKKIEPNLSGKKAVVVGRSNLNGKPMTQLLLKENCTVTITHSKTSDLKGECLKGDIIVAAVGIPELVKGDWVKKDAIVIDVGINKTEKGIVGDVAFDEVSKVAKALTPVPGGVGPMTIACLLKNTIECFKRSQK